MSEELALEKRMKSFSLSLATEKKIVYKMASANAPVVQLDRIPDYESGGRRFESFRVRH
jgi:hypothetical protein